jgi:hypothetical protein
LARPKGRKRNGFAIAAYITSSDLPLHVFFFHRLGMMLCIYIPCIGRTSESATCFAFAFPSFVFVVSAFCDVGGISLTYIHTYMHSRTTPETLWSLLVKLSLSSSSRTSTLGKFPFSARLEEVSSFERGWWWWWILAGWLAGSVLFLEGLAVAAAACSSFVSDTGTSVSFRRWAGRTCRVISCHSANAGQISTQPCQE